MRRGCRAEQDGAYGGAVRARGLEYVEEDVGRVQIGADQHVGSAAERGVEQAVAAHVFGQRGVAVHLAVAFDVRRELREQVAREAHFARRGAARRTVVGVRQERHLGRQAKALHLFGGHERDGRELLGARVFVDVGIGDEQGVLVEHQRVHGREARRTLFHTQDVADVVEVAVKAPHQPAQHGVGVAQVHHQGGDQGVGAAHCGLGGLGRDTAAAHEAVVSLPILAKARVVFGVANFHVAAGLDAQARFGDARGDHGRAADQDGAREPVIDGHLGRAQHALVLAFGVGHAPRLGFGRSEHGAHEHAGLIDEAREAFAVSMEVGNGARGHARLGRGLRHGGRDAQNQAHVERRGDEVIRPEAQLLARVGGGHFVAHLGFGKVGDLAHAGELHGVRDLGRAAVERAAEDVRKAQHVVDLVRVVRAARGDDAVGAHGLGELGADFGLGVGEREDDGLVRHGLDHLGREHAGRRAAKEHVRALHHVGQRARAGVLCVARLGFVIAAGAAFIDHALGVHHEDVFTPHAELHHHIDAGKGRCARARDGHLDRIDALAHELQAVEQRGARDDGRAVLVVVEHRDVHALAQLALDVKALGRLDVLEVDAAQRGFERGDDFDELVRVALGEFDVEHVDAGKLFEQAAFALHHGLARERADVAQPEHGRAVGDHAHEVAARGVVEGLGRIGVDVQAGVGHAGRVSEREVALVRQRLGRTHGNFAAHGRAVIGARGVAQDLFGGGEGLGHAVVK